VTHTRKRNFAIRLYVFSLSLSLSLTLPLSPLSLGSYAVTNEATGESGPVTVFVSVLIEKVTIDSVDQVCSCTLLLCIPAQAHL